MTLRYGISRFAGGPWRSRRGTGELVASLMSDLRIGGRMLWKTRGLSALAVFTMALGIGAATHAFSLITGTILRLPPIADADRLVVVANAYRPDYVRRVTQQEYLDLTTLVELPLEEPAAFFERPVSLASEDRVAGLLSGALMSPRAFAVVGVEPFMGRVFDDVADATDGGLQVVISYEVWRTVFASDPGVIGRAVRADGVAGEIVGVMPDGFGFPFDAQAWLPLDLATTVDGRTARSVDLFGRIPEGLDPATAQGLFDSAARRLADTQPDRYGTLALETILFSQLPFAPQWFTAGYAAFAASLGVLFIACVNAANLLLARSSLRYGEVAIRMALGASRTRVIRQLLVETAALAAVGTVLGLGLAAVGVPFVAHELASKRPPYWVGPGIDGQVLLFAMGAMVATSLLAGVYPAVRATRPGLDEVLRDGTRGSSLRMGRVGRWLVVSEIAVSCGLLIVAGLTIKSLTNLRGLELGFDPDPVFTAAVAPFAAPAEDGPIAGPPARVADASPTSTWRGQEAFYREVLSRVEGLAPVWSAAISSGVPGVGGFGSTITVEGAVYERPEDHPIVRVLIVTEGFFETLGLPIELGREIAAHETWDPDEAAAVVSRSFVRRALQGRPPLGARVKVGLDDQAPRYARIVGVVPDAHAASALGGLSVERRDPAQLFLTPGAFVPAGRQASGQAVTMSLLVRTAGRHDTLFEDVRWAVSSVDPDAPMSAGERLADVIDASLWNFRLIATVFTVVGLLALFLAAVGVYGVVAFSVGQSTQELGIRIALGADTARIRRIVLGRVGAQMAVGLGLGLLVGYALARPVASFSVGVDARDPAVYAVIALTLLVTGLVATALPVRAATRVDPVLAMRE
jgi:predicted permease